MRQINSLLHKAEENIEASVSEEIATRVLKWVKEFLRDAQEYLASQDLTP